MDIREALSKLDLFDDSQWTDEGSPKIDAVKQLLGRPVKREEIINAAPHFSRENPIIEGLDEVDVIDDEVLDVEPLADNSFIEAFKSLEPMQPAVFLGFLQRVPKELLQELLEVMQAQQREIAQAKKDLEEKDRMIRVEILHTKARIQREIPDISDREANMLYIKRQQEIRAQKYAATSALLKGIDPRTLDPRAQIDRAMAKKTARGGNRPQIPRKG